MNSYTRNDLQLEWIEKFTDNPDAKAKKLSGTPMLRALWFVNPTNPRSLRLSHTGYKWNKELPKLPFWEITLDSHITGKQLLQLERVFTSPYYLKAKSIIVFSEEDCIMLQLHGGNLAQYLSNAELCGPNKN